MIQRIFKHTLFLVTLSSCGIQSTTSSGISSNDASKVLNLVSKSLKVTGESMVGPTNPSITVNDCDPNLDYQPIADNNPKYPGRATFCSLTKLATQVNTLSFARGLFCEIEKNGIIYDNLQRDMTLTIPHLNYDKNCWPDNSVSTEDVSAPITVVGSTPATFNPSYEKGVVINLGGALVELGFNLNSSKAEVTFSAINNTLTPSESNGFAADLNFDTGDMHYEDREQTPIAQADCINQQCQALHTALYSKIVFNSLEPTSAEKFSYAYSKTQKNMANIAQGTFVTTDGDTVKGFKSRRWDAWGTANLNITDIKDHTQWTESVNDKCYTSTSDTANTCMPLLAGFNSSPVKFILSSSNSPLIVDWLSTFTLPTFTSVNVNSDNQ